MLNMMMQHCLVGGDGRDSGRVALIDSSVFLEHPPPPIPPPPPPPPTPPPPARANQPIMLLCQQAAISMPKFHIYLTKVIPLFTSAGNLFKFCCRTIALSD